MSHVYDEDLQQIIRDTAAANEIPLKEGVYVQLTVLPLSLLQRSECFVPWEPMQPV